ncbi:hypothetical protein GGR55DRAFT_699270 [Xylaria sp. FL0064]|nr:hypothetical protein GGR55DRAFT_699270 [Xylaria sp. FL0064]
MSESTDNSPALTSYEYIVIGSGPGGGPLAANLARRGHSVLLLEAGDDQGQNLNQKIPFFWAYASEDPSMRWDFFVKHYSDDKQAAQDPKMVWDTPDGTIYVGLDPPEGSKQKGIWYPRAGALGGCSGHNASAAVLPHDSDWEYIAKMTGDESWEPEKMRKYYERVERCHYLPKGTPGHGFNGWLETDTSDPVTIASSEPIVRSAINVVGLAPGAATGGPTKGMAPDLNAIGGQRADGLYTLPLTMSKDGRRSGARNYIVATSNARHPDGSKKYPLHIKTRCFATKLLFAPQPKGNKTPRAIGVEYFEGESLYKADPRYDSRRRGVCKQAFASREVIVAGGTFNTPQLLMLNGIGPQSELEKFGIPVIVDLPGVGSNLQDNYEMSVVGRSPEAYSIFKEIGGGGPGDLALAEWVKGFGVYKNNGVSFTVLKKSEHSAEEDLFLFGLPGVFTGFYPGFSKALGGDAYEWTWDVLQFRPHNSSGTVRLKSSDPFDVPEINFEYFAPPPQSNGENEEKSIAVTKDTNTTNNLEHDVTAITEGVHLARKILSGVAAPVGPFAEVQPPPTATTAPEIKAAIRADAFGHHAASTCRIGAADDALACLDSRFRVRGVDSLRVVDASVFPRAVGTFPTLSLYCVSEKACDVILEDAANEHVRHDDDDDDKVLDGVRDREVLVDDAWTNEIVRHQVEQNGIWGLLIRS